MGGAGRSWAANVIPRIEDVELVACVDISPQSLELTRASTSLAEDRYFRSLEDALQATEADAVLVTTTLPAHIPVTMAALSAGKHVLMEKPFAPTLDDARRAVDAATERGLVLMVNQNYRFFPAVRAVRELVASGDVGSPHSIYLDFRRYEHHAPKEGHLHYLVPQPMLVDMAIHHFDLMRAILNREPQKIYCRSWNPPWSRYDDPAAAVATITFEGDVVVSYRGSWLSPGIETPWAGNWRMEFSGAEVAWTSRGGGKDPEDAESAVIRRLGEESRQPQFGVARSREGTRGHPIDLPKLSYLDFTGSLDAFVRAIRSGEEPETSGRNNLPTLALAIAAVESAASGMPVEL